MRWSNLFIPTLKEDPARVESQSQRLLIRAGYVRQFSAGLYGYLPLGLLVKQRILGILREEMNAIGAQEVSLPCLQSASIWQESGRFDELGENLWHLKDRRQAEYVLSLSGEEAFSRLAASGINSYKQLPQIWYQIQNKFRDEARPRGGLLRLREFCMKDSYSFDQDEAGLQRSFDLHRQAYKRIFKRFELDTIEALADSYQMGQSESIEFMLCCEAGEDILLSCTQCSYAANIEFAEAALPAQVKDHIAEASPEPLQEFATPAVKSIKQLCEFAGIESRQTIKTLLYKSDAGLVMALLRGDHELSLNKLRAILSCRTMQAASAEEVFWALGAQAGSLGPFAVKSGLNEKIKSIIADSALQGAVNMVSGANKDDFHLKGLDLSRDLSPNIFADIRQVQETDSCKTCNGRLQLRKALELAHIFKLQTFYSSKLKAEFLAADGSSRPLFMGSYGIGVDRLMAGIAERFHDQNGLCWPIAVAPFQVIVLPVQMRDSVQAELAVKVYAELKNAGLDVLLDDRDERAGVKFKDADLLGIPLRVNLGKRAAEGVLEVVCRRPEQRLELGLEQLPDFLINKIKCPESRAAADLC